MGKGTHSNHHQCILVMSVHLFEQSAITEALQPTIHMIIMSRPKPCAVAAFLIAAVCSSQQYNNQAHTMTAIVLQRFHLIPGND